MVPLPPPVSVPAAMTREDILMRLFDVDLERSRQLEKVQSISIGSRIKCDEHVGTVKYIGEVEGYSGTWYGIDWDDASRGKHDGSVKGVKYFTASGRTSGSFIRPNKVNPGQTCAQAIQNYYGEQEDEQTAALNKAMLNDLKKKIKVPFIEMIGFEKVHRKQKNLNCLVEAYVRDMGIWTAGDLRTLCQSLKSLDLSKNLLNSWKSVSEIAVQLPQLEILDASQNRLQLPEFEEEAAVLSVCFNNVKKLSISTCNIGWQEFMIIWKMFLQLEVAVLAFNNIRTIDIPEYFCDISPGSPSYFANISDLVLDNNPLESFSEVLKLKNLPKLTCLSINDCTIKNIVFNDAVDEKFQGFYSLETLHLKNNEISDWRSISELDKLPKLHKLFFIKNPLFEQSDYDTTCQHVIARLSELKELNGSELTKEAKRGAEYDYLKKHGLQWKNLSEKGEDLKEFNLMHSRFKYLVEKHGLPEDSLIQKKPDTWAINSNLIEITFKDEITGKCVKKKLPSTISVQKLVPLAKRMFSSCGISSSSIPVFHYTFKNKDGSEMNFSLNNQMKGLDFFSVNNGDTLLIRWS